MVRCGICDDEAVFKYRQDNRTLDVCASCMMIFRNEEMHNDLEKRVEKLEEMITKLNGEVPHITYANSLDQRITKLEKQLKNLTEQVDLNAQTLQEISALDDARSTGDY